MKILVIQENGRHEKNRNYRECFSLQRAFRKNGHLCDIWGLNHNSFNIKPDFNSYDIIFDLENYDTGWIPDLSTVKSYKIIWEIDAHVRGINYYLNRFNKNKCQLMLHSTRDYVKTERDLWFPNCLDDELVFPLNIPKRADIGFCGNICNRQLYLDELKRNFNFISDIFVIGDYMVKSINSYRIHFNKNISNDINYRNFETIGCKIPLITNKNEQYKDLGFKENENCVFYDDIHDLIDKVKYMISNEEFRNKIAQNGYELSRKHTYKKRICDLLNQIKI